MVCPLFLESLSPRKQFGSVTASGRGAIPDSGKIRFVFRSAWCRTFGRLGPAEKKSPKTCAIFAKRFQGNEVTDRNVDTLSLTGLDHNDVFVFIPLKPNACGCHLILPRRQLRKRVGSC